MATSSASRSSSLVVTVACASPCALRAWLCNSDCAARPAASLPAWQAAIHVFHPATSCWRTILLIVPVSSRLLCSLTRAWSSSTCLSRSRVSSSPFAPSANSSAVAFSNASRLSVASSSAVLDNSPVLELAASSAAACAALVESRRARSSSSSTILRFCSASCVCTDRSKARACARCSSSSAWLCVSDCAESPAASLSAR
mmetsp:Transcript_57178/g.157741  ORF Transcript_57178/g.157741 Transcript_57178/m.157741 type:complete len:200 (-) Transcript_57178:332-931(-)